MVEALLTLTVSEQGGQIAEQLDLAALAEDALEQAGDRIEQAELQMDVALAQAATRGDAHLVERMVWNLVDNAVRHNVEGGWIRIRTGADDDQAYIRIANSGAVIPDSALGALAEPFYRLAGRTGEGGGFGLGLSIAKSVSSAHGATMTVINPACGGLDILVRMPPPS